MKKRKPKSLYFSLLLPLELILVILVGSIVASANFIYKENVETTSNQNLRTTGEQLLGTYDAYFSQIFKNSDVVISSFNETDDPSSFKVKMDATFSGLLSLKEEVIGTSIYNANDGALITSAGKIEASSNAKNEGWFKQTFSSNENKLIPILTLPSIPNPVYPYMFTLSRYASYDRDSSFDAVIRIDFSFNQIVNVLSETALGEGSSFLIYDKEYREVYSSLPSDFASKKGILQNLVMGVGNYNLGDHSFFVFASTISSTSWRLGVFLNNDAVHVAISNFTLYTTLIGAALALVSAFIFLLVSRKSVKPILLLSSKMSQIVSLEELPSKHLNIEGSKEIVELDNSFIALIDRIDDLTKKLIFEKEEQRKSELLALQNQINPHFLYNTLDSILALIEEKENDKAEEMIVALSRFFRISISKGKNIIPLRKEIEHAKNYLLIQKLRFGDAFDYSFDVSEDILDMDIVKLVLQPIIENSINHGLKEGEVGLIKVKGYKNNGYVYLSISDNGYGMIEETRLALENSLKDESSSKGVGLKNVYMRLRVYYGNKADMKIESALDIGTTITLIIPEGGEREK